MQKRTTADDRNPIDFSPQMSRASRTMFGHFHLLLLVGLLLAMFAAAMVAG
jgi:hypothetical protein